MVMSIKEYNKERIDLLIYHIRNKKEFSNIDYEFVRELIYKKINKRELLKIIEHKKPQKSKEFKVAIKIIRKILHEVYGVFNIDKNRYKLLKDLEKEAKETGVINEHIKEIHNKILNTHRSTKERLPYYNEIYNKIFGIIKPKSILDLSAGLNPLSYPWMNIRELNYIATEFTDNDVKFLNQYFDIMRKFGLNGRAVKLDLLKLKKLLRSDICFIFKTLDSLETLKEGITKNILNNINSKFIIVSFPTKTLSGKRLNKKRLIWFDRLISNYTIFEVENEIFYIINKTKLY